jgi:flagellar hook-basal body complex protein FliE
MDVRSTLAIGAYADARTNVRPEAAASAGAAAFAGAVEGLAATLREGEVQARAAVSTGADPHSLVMALAQTELAVETAVTIRNRVVEAYQEILRMPV